MVCCKLGSEEWRRDRLLGARTLVWAQQHTSATIFGTLAVKNSAIRIYFFDPIGTWVACKDSIFLRFVRLIQRRFYLMITSGFVIVQRGISREVLALRRQLGIHKMIALSASEFGFTANCLDLVPCDYLKSLRVSVLKHRDLLHYLTMSRVRCRYVILMYRLYMELPEYIQAGCTVGLLTYIALPTVQ